MSQEEYESKQDKIEKSNGRALFEALVARAKRPEPNPKANTMLRDLFGRSERDKNRADTAAAAAAVGVSTSTVRRWIRDGLPAHSDAAARVREQWKNSPTGRKRRLGTDTTKRFATPTAPGAPLIAGRVTGNFYVSNDPRNGKPRSFAFDMDDADSTAMMQAMLDGDDQGAFNAWADAVGEDIWGGSGDFSVITDTEWHL